MSNNLEASLQILYDHFERIDIFIRNKESGFTYEISCRQPFRLAASRQPIAQTFTVTSERSLMHAIDEAARKLRRKP